MFNGIRKFCARPVGGPLYYVWLVTVAGIVGVGLAIAGVALFVQR